MKRFLALALPLALCALFAPNAAARTLYVDCRQPNNGCNGRSPNKAKKTIQAAINVARKGDTILVYPGDYIRFKTKNRKVRIKSVAGRESTLVLSGVRKGSDGYIIADLAAWSKNVYAYHAHWHDHEWTGCSKMKKSTASTIQGLTLRPSFVDDLYYDDSIAITGGVAKNCAIEHCPASWNYPYLAFPSASVPGGLECTAAWPVILNAKLVGCTVSDSSGCRETKGSGRPETPNSAVLVEGSTFVRCSVLRCGMAVSEWNPTKDCKFRNSTFVSCLFAERNYRPSFIGCTMVNCTLADNIGVSIKGTKAFNTVFHGVAASQFGAERKNSLKKCYKGTAPGFVREAVWPPNLPKWRACYASYVQYLENGTSEYVDNGEADVWAGAIPGDYRLRPDSPCIDRGRLTKAQKKLVGTKDLAGRKRIKGKAIDRGCYEH